ncbi:MAG TPA: hypothetical protein VGJ97_00065 [Anaerolineaceae bacterium]|jgi:hypothetical protein
MSHVHHHEHTPWILWPFVALWRLLAGIILLTGRLVALVLGVVFMLVGIILTITVVGAILGIPLLIFGFLLILRGFF